MMERLWLSGLLLGVALTGTAQELPSPQGVITGHVLTVEGDPVEGAAIHALRAEGGEAGSAVSDDRGEFRIAGLKRGVYTLRAETGPNLMLVAGPQHSWSYPVRASQARRIAVTGSTVADGNDFVLPLAPQAAAASQGLSASGHVVEWSDGSGVANAVVELVEGQQRWRVRTDRDGRFAFENLPAGSYQIRVWSSGHLPEVPEWLRGVESRQINIVAGKPLSGLRLRVMREGVATGRVLANGRPVANAMISANRLVMGDSGRELKQVTAAFTDDHGEFRLAHLPAGRYYLAASVASLSGNAAGPERTLFPQTEHFAEALAVEVRAGTPTVVDMSMAVKVPHAVQGMVDVPPGAVNAHVLLLPHDPVVAQKFGNWSATADAATGIFTVNDVWPGIYDLVAEAQVDGHDLRGGTEVTVGDAEVTGLRVALNPLLRVHGVMHTDSEGQCSFEGAEVELRRGSGQGELLHAAVLQDGSFTLEKMERGTYRLQVRGLKEMCAAVPSGGGSSGEVTVTDSSTTLDLDLRAEGGSIRGMVTDADGNGVAGIRLLLAGVGEDVGQKDLQQQVVSGVHGEFLLEGLVPGRYVLFRMSDEDADETLPLNDGQDVDVNAHMTVDVSVHVN
jgi:hypothetical protein